MILKNLNTVKLRQLLLISSSVTKEKDAVINLQIEATNKVSSITTNENGDVYKRWSCDLMDICESVENKNTELLKISIFKGDEFAKKTLTLFGQLVDLEIQYNEEGAVKMIIRKINNEDKVIASVSVIMSRTNLSWVDFPQDEADIVFGLTDSPVLDKFNLSGEDIKNVSKMLSVDTNPEEQKKYIIIKSEDGHIVATDKGWRLTLGLDTFELTQEIEIAKDLWKMFDDYENYVVHLSEISENKFIFAKAENSDLTTSMVLLKDVDSSIDFNDFEHYNTQGY